jgi:hypothetical protein
MDNEKKQVTYNSSITGETQVTFDIQQYMNNRAMFIGLMCNEDGYEEPFGDVTVNLSVAAPNYCGYLNVNDMPDIEKFITDNDLGEFTGFTQRSGFCEYPLYLFNVVATYEGFLAVSKALKTILDSDSLPCLAKASASIRYISAASGGFRHEDFGNLIYLMDNALRSGMTVKEIQMEQIGLTPENRFVDLEDKEIYETKPKANFGQYPKDYFDFIIIDECHRGGANDESSWREILEYFSPATQLGLTATPKRDVNADT